MMRFRTSSALGALLLAGACGGDNLVLPEDGVPSTISIVSGNPQNGTVGAALASPLIVRILDAAGRPVQGQQVTFTVVSGGGSVTPATPSTGADGQATAAWTLGPSAGAQQVQAKATGGAAPDNLTVLFNAVAGASAAANLIAVSGGGQTGTAGSTLSDSLIVRVTDGAGNPVGGVAVTWTVTGGGSVSAATSVTGDDGRTGVRHTLGAVAGAQTAVATSAGLSGSPITFAATAAVGSAGKLFINRQPSSTAASGAVFAQQPRIQIQDANGNNVAAAGRAISAELIGPPGATLNGAATVSTNASGLATFANLSIVGPAGSYTLNFTGTDLTGVTSTPITLTAGAASKLVFSAQPSSGTAGAVITPPVRVTIQDALGQTVTGATNAVTVALAANPSGGTLSGTRTVNAVNGVATFSTLEIDRAGTGYALSAAATGLSGATSASFNILAGTATTLAASTSPGATTVAGSTVAPAPAVRATDASGNPVAGVSVTFTAVNGGSVAGETQTTNASGIATVGSWTIGPVAGTEYQLQASASGLSGSPVTFATTATAGSAGQLTIETQPAATAQSGVALNPQPSVQLRDANGNPVSSAGVSITATISNGPGGTLTNATATTNGSGRATFSGLAITGPSGTYTLSFAGPSISGVTSNDIVLGSGAAAKLAIATQPSSTVENGQIFPQQPVIQLQDATGNPVGAAGITVTAVLQPAAGATLGGDLSVQTNSSGVATFTDLRITGDLAQRTILFASTGLTSVSSDPITVTPGVVGGAQSSISRSPSVITASAPGGGGSTITVTARDGSGNPVPGVPVSLLTVSGSGVFSAIGPTNASGVAIAAFTSTEAGAKTIGAEIDGVTIAGTVGITVNAAGALAANSSLVVSPGTITAGGAGTTATVTARDAFGNLVEGANVTVSMTNGGASPASGQANASGVFATTLTSATVGTQTVTATVEGAELPSASVEVAAIPTTTSVTTSVTPSLEGQSVTFTAAVSSSGPTPGGIVSFYDGGTCAAPGTSIGSNALSDGSTTVATSALAAGTYTIVACYPGNAIFAASSGNVAQTVNQDAGIVDGSLSSVGAREPGPVGGSMTANRVSIPAL